jgi:hypothetical protein
MMEETLNRQFVKTVLSRAKSCTGLGLEAKTIEDYTHRVMTLKKIGVWDQIADPELLLNTLTQRYSKPTSILTAMRPGIIFLQNLTDEERIQSGLGGCSVEDVALKFKAIVTHLNSQVKNNKKRVQNS